MTLDRFAGVRVSDLETAKAWYRDADGYEIGYGGPIVRQGD